ncbi:MAG: hypothetical protein JNJ60_04235 [Rhodocyclaceae bacterium]|nr:hypothetical protein [Rhodocyclaceae bacterium]
MATKLQPASARHTGLVYALLLSCLLHIGLLWPALVAREPLRVAGARAGAIEVRLAAAPAAAATAPEPDAAATARARPARNSGTIDKPRQAHEPRPATAAAQPAAEAGAEPAAGTGPAPDADALRHYRWALALAARELRGEVETLAAASDAGVVRLRVEHDARGIARAVSVGASSGHADADLGAKRLIARALDRVALPPSLQGRAFVVEISVELGSSE